MRKLRLLTGGESHGPGLTAILEGLPAGLEIDRRHIDGWLRRRQHGFGRGGRQRIESDEVRVTGGLRDGCTLGSPLVLEVANRATQHLYIVNPIKPFEKRAKGLFSTHPPLEERIARLRALA